MAAITYEELEGRVWLELPGVDKKDLPASLILSYANTVQDQMVLLLGPVVEPIFRARETLAAAASLAVINSGAGAYDHAGGTWARLVNGFTGLSPDAYIDKEIIIHGEWTAVEKVYRDIITDNNATEIQIAGNCGLSADSDAGTVTAIIVSTPSAVDAGTAGYTIPDECLKPLYLSDNTTPSSESRIDIIQVDDTERFLDFWYKAEVRAALQIGNTIRLFKGSSASFPTDLVLTYVKRPVKFASASDKMLISEGRLPEDYAEILMDGILQRASRHLKRPEDAIVAQNAMTAGIKDAMSTFNFGMAVDREEKATRK